jgi:lysine N6-hydroxylase
MDKHYNLVGVGIGPFHLSLAALISKVDKLKTLFLDQKPSFLWHPELMFNDAVMQTSYLKDLVTPVDPTNPYSFLNFLTQHGLFYSFMNTGRQNISRREFEMYCQWTSQKLGDDLKFNSQIESVDFDKDRFIIRTKQESYTSDHLSIATGLTPYIPECALKLIGPEVFHAKSPVLQNLDLKDKRVLIIGGGQTGVEIFRNTVSEKWGRVKNVRLISRRQNLEPLDESPFTNEYFTPSYVDDFFSLEKNLKAPIVNSQKLASDGNTPQYLEKLYNDLYHLKHVLKDTLDFKILPFRNFIGIEKSTLGYKAIIQNEFIQENEIIEADIIILATGFVISTPKILEPIQHLLSFDDEGRFIIKRNFDLDWKGPAQNKIYALNFSRHHHGIAEPQTSLMAWRSATIINDITQEEIYRIHQDAPCFVHYGKI